MEIDVAISGGVDSDNNFDSSLGDDSNSYGETILDFDSEQDIIGEDSDSDTVQIDSYYRLPFTVSSLDDELFRVLAEENDLSLPGAWYGYVDQVGSTQDFYTEKQGVVCMSGEVATYNGIGGPFSWTFAGASVELCHIPGESDDPYSIGNCPYVANLEKKIVGVSFQVEGGIPPWLELHFREPKTNAPAFFQVSSNNRTDYLFEDAITSENGVPITVSNVTNVQLQVGNSESATTPFELCIRDFALLVAN